MKLKDFVSHSIQNYPSLFKDVDYEKSMLKVLNHIFFTIGNGIELAHTLKPEEGGYAVHPKYVENKDTDEWIRVHDLPYGVKKFKELPKDYFETDVYYVSSMEKPLDILKSGEYYYFRFEKENDDKFNFGKPTLRIAKSDYNFTPYPFSKNYSIACNIFYNDLFLQPDWMEGLIFLCKKTLEYFNDENQYKEDSYYPRENSIKYDLRIFEERVLKGIADLNKLQEIWGYEIKNECPTYEEVKKRKETGWTDYKEKQVNFLEEFLLKYDK